MNDPREDDRYNTNQSITTNTQLVLHYLASFYFNVSCNFFKEKQKQDKRDRTKNKKRRRRKKTYNTNTSR